MTLLTALAPMLQKAGTQLTLSVTANDDQTLTVIITPLSGPVPENASDALKKLKAAFATPIRATGTAEEIETLLVNHINEQAPQRNAWANRAAAMEAEIAAASTATPNKKASSKPASKAPTATAPAQEQTSIPAPEAADTTTDADLNTSAGFSL